MIFIGTPNLLVRFRKSMRQGRKIGIRFDANGEYETTNPRLIHVLSAKFKAKEAIEEDLEAITYNDLKLIAKDKGINSFGIKKEELVKLLKEV